MTQERKIIQLDPAAVVADTMLLETSAGGNLSERITVAQLAAHIQQGTLSYKGTWNAATNSPTLVSGTGVKGNFYLVAVTGNTALDGTNHWTPGDWVAFNGTIWTRVAAVGLPAAPLNLTGISQNYTITGNVPAFISIDTTADNISLIFPSLSTSPPALSIGQSTLVYNAGSHPIQLVVGDNDSASLLPQEMLLGFVHLDNEIDWISFVSQVNGKSGIADFGTGDFAETEGPQGLNLWFKDSRAQTSAETKINSLKGQPNGLASLDVTGKVPTSQLPATTFPVTSVNNLTGAVSLNSDLVPQGTTNLYANNAMIDARINAQKGQPGGLCPLDSNTNVPIGDIPPLTFNAPLSGGFSGGQVNFGYNGTYFAVVTQQLTLSTPFLNSRVLSVNNIFPVANNITLTSASIGLANVDNTSDVNKPVSTATQAALNSKADLVGGVIPTSQIPTLSIVDFLGHVANQAAMLALTGQKGDWCIRDDQSATWIITGSNPALLSSWTEIAYPTSSVMSVNGQTGTVVLSKSDLNLGNVDNTSDVNKPISTATQTALNLKADAAATQTSLNSKADATTTQNSLNLKADKSITFSAGNGLTGGGDLSANRSYALNVDTNYYGFVSGALQFSPQDVPLKSLTTTQINALTAVVGKIAYDSTKGFFVYYNGAAWLPLCSYCITTGYNTVPGNGTVDLIFNDPTNSAPFAVPKAGQIYMLSICGNTAITGGTVTLNIVKNGVAQTAANSSTSLAFGGNAQSNSRILPTPITVAVNDRISLRITTAGASPANLDVTAAFWIADF
jgi:hypothetical protein